MMRARFVINLKSSPRPRNPGVSVSWPRVPWIEAHGDRTRLRRMKRSLGFGDSVKRMDGLFAAIESCG